LGFLDRHRSRPQAKNLRVVKLKMTGRELRN
jgi:hypothetical protein